MDVKVIAGSHFAYIDFKEETAGGERGGEGEGGAVPSGKWYTVCGDQEEWKPETSSRRKERLRSIVGYFTTVSILCRVCI